MGEKILVTGASGSIGSYVTQRLIDAGYQVTGLTRSSENAALLESRGVTPVIGSMNDVPALEKGLAGAFAVVHLAGWMGVAKFSSNAVEQNVHGTELLSTQALDAGISHITYLSTIGVYGPLEDNATEDHLLNAKDAYGDTKRRAEEIIRRSGINHTIFRAGPVIGPDINTWTELAYDRVKGRKPIGIGDGRGTFNYTPVHNLADAIVESLTNSAAIKETFNVVGDEQITWRHFLQYYEMLLGTQAIYAPALLSIAGAHTPFLSITPEGVGTMMGTGRVFSEKVKSSLRLRFTPFHEAMLSSLSEFPEFENTLGKL